MVGIVGEDRDLARMIVAAVCASEASCCKADPARHTKYAVATQRVDSGTVLVLSFVFDDDDDGPYS